MAEERERDSERQRERKTEWERERETEGDRDVFYENLNDLPTIFIHNYKDSQSWNIYRSHRTRPSSPQKGEYPRVLKSLKSSKNATEGFVKLNI